MPRMPRLGNLAKALLALAVALAASALLASSSSPGRAASAPLVVIDPGHDRYANSATEPIGPGSSTMKIKDGGGTRGVATRRSASHLNGSGGTELSNPPPRPVCAL